MVAQRYDKMTTISRSVTVKVIIITALITTIITGNSESRIINRLNYGTYFQEVTKTNIQTAHWTHTFKLTLPGYEWGENYDYIATATNATDTERSCARKAAETLLRSRPINPRDNDTYSCIKYKANWLFLATVGHEGHKNLNKLVKAIRTLIPRRGQSINRNTRALLEFIGEASYYVFGTARSRDVELLQNHVKAIAENQKHSLQVIKTSLADMASFTVKNEHRVNDLVATIKGLSLENIRVADQTRNDTMSTVNYLNTATLHTMQLEHTINLLARHYSNVLTAVQTLNQGYLPPYLVTPEMLHQTLQHVTTQLFLAHNIYRLVHIRQCCTVL